MKGCGWIAAAMAVCAAAGTARAAGPEEVGRPAGLVKSASGRAEVARGSQRLAATPGQPLFAGDALVTGSPGTLGVVLRDDTAVSLGSSAEVRLEEFVYEPAEKRLGLVLRIVRGTVGYLSGRIAKLAPDAARIETPVASLGIRGTRLAARIVSE